MFSKICKDIVILGPGVEGLAKKPNESIVITDLIAGCEAYKNLYMETLGETE